MLSRLAEFHLGYNMLINLLRAEGVEPEELMRRSYRQFQNERRLPIMQRKLKAIEVRISLLRSTKLCVCATRVQSSLRSPFRCLPFFCSPNLSPPASLPCRMSAPRSTLRMKALWRLTSRCSG